MLWCSILTEEKALIVRKLKFINLIRFRIPTIVTIAVCAFACKKDSSGTTRNASLTARMINISNHSFGYYEYLPEGYDSDNGNRKYPVLFFFHGAGELGYGNDFEIQKLLSHGPLKLIKNGTFPTSFTVNGETYKFIIIAPQFSIYGIFPEDVDACIEFARKHYNVDANRIYLTGLSLGGAECWNYVENNSNYAHKIAAMVPVAAYLNEIISVTRINPTKAQIIASANLPIWSTHNSGDPISLLSWVKNAHNLVNTSVPAPNPLPRLSVFNDNTHEGWTQTYDPSFKENNMNIYEWMLQYHR